MLLLPHVPRSGTAPSATQRGERTLERSTTGIRRTGGRGHRPSQPRMRSCGLALNATVQMAMIDVVSVAEGVRAGTWSPGRALSDAEDVHRRPNGQEQAESDEPRHDDPSRQLDGALLEHGGQAAR